MLSKTVDDIIKQIDFKPDIDLFSSSLNKKIPRFVSSRPDPKSIAVNAFNLDLGVEKYFCISKIHLCTRCTAKNMEGQNTCYRNCGSLA